MATNLLLVVLYVVALLAGPLLAAYTGQQCRQRSRKVRYLFWVVFCLVVLAGLAAAINL